MNQTLPDYSLVVVSFGSGVELGKFFESLARSEHLPTEVVVVENGPELPVFPPMKGIPVTVLHRPENPGYGAAVNYGVQNLSTPAPWVLIANPDITVDSTTIPVLLSVASKSNDAGALGPALLNPDGSVYPSARAVPGIGVGIGHALLGALWKKNPWTTAYRGRYDSDDARDCGWLSGACVVVNKQAFESIGGFDTGYFMFMEDVDLGMRLGQAGFRNIYVPTATATHLVGHSTSHAHSTMAKAHHDSAKRFITKRYPGFRYWPVRLVITLGLTLRQWVVQGLGREKPNQAS